MLELFISAMTEVFRISNIFIIIGGVGAGLIFGAVPGLSTTMAIALCLPLTFGMDTNAGLSLLLGLYIGGFSGGLVSAILLNVPGTAASVATTFDGYPMANRGQAGKALGLGICSSFAGGLISIIALIFVSPLLAGIAIKFGSFEYFSLMLFALTMIVTMSSKNILRGTMSGILGMLFAMIGGAPIDGLPRLTFGNSELNGGLNTVAVLIGIFAVSELFLLVRNGGRTDTETVKESKMKGFGFSIAEWVKQTTNIIRSSVIGVLIGILPGIGGSLASIVSYDIAKKTSKHSEKFGTGIPDGIVASESANNAAIGGAMIPLLSLGIPGDAVTALLLGAMTMQGIAPGPLLFSSNPKLIYFIFIVLLVANLAMLILEFGAIRGFVHLLRIPKNILLPAISLLCILGAYGLSHRVFDVVTICVFGIIGYFMKKWEFSFQPFIIGYIIGPSTELYFRRSLMYSDNSILPFFTSPISCIFIIVSVISILFSVRKVLKSKQA